MVTSAALALSRVVSLKEMLPRFHIALPAQHLKRPRCFAARRLGHFDEFLKLQPRALEVCVRIEC